LTCGAIRSKLEPFDTLDDDPEVSTGSSPCAGTAIGQLAGKDMMAGKHRAKRFGGGTLVLLIVLAVLILGSAGTAYAAMRYDQARTDQILPGITVEGVNVGGMTRAQAIAAVQPVVGRSLATTITVSAGHTSWTKSLAELGVSADVERAVGQALAVNQRYPWWSRAYHRLADKPVNQTFDIALRYDTTPVSAFVTTVARKVRVTGVDASYALVGGAVHMNRSKAGVVLASRSQATALLSEAVRTGEATVSLTLATAPPKVPTSAVGKAIVVNVSKNMLYLYDDFKVIRTYHVATAMQGFVTPDGAWEVINKVVNPTWTNPCLGQPGCWAASEPAVIPPGPGNPLGTRALYLNAPGIRIHGTPSDSSIGSWASHGCIRMHISESEALYPLVPIGTPVFIVGAPPWGISQSAGPAG
jgi:lipoprotein-anchoring transpeptidase ErfK/SrfK